MYHFFVEFLVLVGACLRPDAVAHDEKEQKKLKKNQIPKKFLKMLAQ